MKTDATKLSAFIALLDGKGGSIQSTFRKVVMIVFCNKRNYQAEHADVFKYYITFYVAVKERNKIDNTPNRTDNTQNKKWNFL